MFLVVTTRPDAEELASELVVQAARLVRAVRATADLPAGFRVLSLLDEHGPLGITALATIDRCSQPTMSASVAQLAGRGWVDKRPNPADARGSVVTLTDAGRDQLTALRRANGRAVAARLAAHPGRTTEEVAIAVAVLRDALAPTPLEGTS